MNVFHRKASAEEAHEEKTAMAEQARPRAAYRERRAVATTRFPGRICARRSAACAELKARTVPQDLSRAAQAPGSGRHASCGGGGRGSSGGGRGRTEKARGGNWRK